MSYTVKRLICKCFCYRLSYNESEKLCKWVKESDENRRQFLKIKRYYFFIFLTRKLDVLTQNNVLNKK